MQIPNGTDLGHRTYFPQQSDLVVWMLNLYLTICILSRIRKYIHQYGFVWFYKYILILQWYLLAYIAQVYPQEQIKYVKCEGNGEIKLYQNQSYKSYKIWVQGQIIWIYYVNHVIQTS